MKKEAIQENLALVQNTLERWISFKKFLLFSYTDQEIGSEEEANFLEIKSNVARNVRTLGERFKAAASGMDYGEKTIRDLLNKCVSVTHLRGLPLNDRRHIYKEWHTAFIRLSRSVGALKFLSEGYVPPDPTKKKKGKGGAVSAIIAVVVVVLLAVVGFAIWLFTDWLPF